MTQSLTIVSGASSNHFRCLKNLLYSLSVFEPRSRTIVYDLGLKASEADQLKTSAHELRRFQFEKFPAHVKVQPAETPLDKGPRAGNYAWKPIILSEILHEFGGMVLWLDAGNLVRYRLDKVRKVLSHNGIYSPRSADCIAKWTHHGTLKYLAVSSDLLNKRNRNGAIVGFLQGHSGVSDFVDRWRACALDPECIAPPGSSHLNHRYDQAVLSVLMYQFQKKYLYEFVDEKLDISTHNDRLSPDAARKKMHQLHNSTTGISSLHSSAVSQKTVDSSLRNLILVPSGGMCNRLRAIASARRLCARLNARCSVVWEWGDFESFFMPLSDTEILSSHSGTVAKRLQHRPFNVNPIRTVDIDVESVEVHSGYVFWGSHESKINLAQVKDYLPTLNPHLREVVVRYSSQHLKNAVGFHMRRTDQKMSIRHSPDELFFSRARKVIDSGKKIFLATDNLSTESRMKHLFRDAVITFPKRQQLVRRWPRAFDQTAAEDDLIELFLLANTEYILGSYFSSFSGMAIMLNGSPQSIILNVQDSSTEPRSPPR